MRYFRKTVLLVVSSILLVALTTSVAFAQDPDNGKVIWEEQALCQRCHGLNGEGVWGKPLAGDTELSVEQWIAQVRNPRNRMPTFSEEKVSDQMIRDMFAYITSLPVPAEFGFKDPGLPDDAHPGQVLVVEKRCVACHTTTGIMFTRFARGEAIPSAELVINQLRNPFRNMPSFREDQVSDEEAAIIAEFLLTQVPPEALPQSGGAETASTATSTTLGLSMVLGLILLAGGFVLRRRTARL